MLIDSQEKLNFIMTEAVKMGDLEDLKSLLQQGADIKYNNFAIMKIALEYGYEDIIEYINDFLYYEKICSMQ